MNGDSKTYYLVWWIDPSDNEKPVDSLMAICTNKGKAESVLMEILEDNYGADAYLTKTYFNVNGEKY